MYSTEYDNCYNFQRRSHIFCKRYTNVSQRRKEIAQSNSNFWICEQRYNYLFCLITKVKTMVGFSSMGFHSAIFALRQYLFAPTNISTLPSFVLLLTFIYSSNILVLILYHNYMLTICLLHQ